jgi:hypothetical protein
MKGNGDENDVGAYAFFYYGTDLTEEGAGRARTSAIELWFPTETVERRGLDAFTHDVLALADRRFRSHRGTAAWRSTSRSRRR